MKRTAAAMLVAAAAMLGQPPHAFENKDTIPAHYYRIELKKIDCRG